jgi:hypothetical protein
MVHLFELTVFQSALRQPGASLFCKVPQCVSSIAAVAETEITVCFADAL